MSYPLDPVVPPALARLLAENPERADGTAVLVTTFDGKWPHLAMVSCGELACSGDGTVMLLAIWPTSTACRNLSTAPNATLATVLDGVSYSIRVEADRLDDVTTPLAGTLARFRLRVSSVSGDEAPYAVLESGVRYRLIEPDMTHARWRQVRAALLEAMVVQG